jgi:hypothetical protein
MRLFHFILSNLGSFSFGVKRFPTSIAVNRWMLFCEMISTWVEGLGVVSYWRLKLGFVVDCSPLDVVLRDREHLD